MKSLTITQAVTFSADNAYIGWWGGEIKFTNNDGCYVEINLEPESLERLFEQLKSRLADYNERHLEELKDKIAKVEAVS